MPSAKLKRKVNFSKKKLIPVVFGTEYCKREEGHLLLYCLVLVGEVNHHQRGILQFQQNHQAYFQDHLDLCPDMIDDFLLMDPKTWENHKMNRNLDSSFRIILFGNAVPYVPSTIVYTTVLYIFAKFEKRGCCIMPHLAKHIFQFEMDSFSHVEITKIL